MVNSCCKPVGTQVRLCLSAGLLQQLQVLAPGPGQPPDAGNEYRRLRACQRDRLQPVAADREAAVCGCGCCSPEAWARRARCRGPRRGR